MEIDEGLLNQVSNFLNTEEGAEIVSGLKSALNLDGGSDGKTPSLNNNALASLFSQGGKSKGLLDGVDMSRLIPLVTAISSAKTDDRATNLLLALKPLLKNERREKVDKAISIMRIMSLLPILEEHGFSISDLFK